MNGPLGERIWVSMVGESIWALRSDEEAFRKAVVEYFARAHPGFKVIRAKHPFIYIQDERGTGQ
ncbi:hypothetical protein C162_20471 [Paenibacillus sp. FSL R7-269]|nr:hypothetical protein C162_20471 [Paenibacillus sp. FSL R7-269]